MAPHHWLLTLIDYVTSSLLHRDCMASPLFLSLRRLDGLSGSTGAYMQDPLITIRVVIFASWRKERTSLESTASVSHPRTRSSCGLWLPFPPSSKVWTIDSSWSLQNSSLVYLDGDFGLCLLWLDLPQTVQKSPASTRGFSVNHISSSVPLASYPGPRIVT